MRAYDLIGKRFGRLIVIEKGIPTRGEHGTVWKCKCDCGNEKYVTTGNLNGGTVRSCGCLRREQAVKRFRDAAKKNIKHGEAGSKLYGIWHCMIQRCDNPKNPVYRWYGAKGVSVCEEWHNYEVFAKWAHSHGYVELKDVPRRQILSIDRIDSDGDYCPKNCRWITVGENTRRGAQNRWKNAELSKGSIRANNIV